MSKSTLAQARTLTDWQGRLSEIYPNKGLEPDYMMTHAYTKCSDIARILLRAEYRPDCDQYIVSTISWLYAISAYFDIDYQKAIVRRFPGCCNYCLEAPCICDQTGKLALKGGRPMSQEDVGYQLMHKVSSVMVGDGSVAINFAWLRSMIRSIYPSNRALLMRGGQAFIVGKMLEEGGELHRAYSKVMMRRELKEPYTTDEIEEELADLTAWLVSCWDLSGLNRDMDVVFSDTFRAGCPECDKPTCKCKHYYVSPSVEVIVSDMHAILKNMRDMGLAVNSIDQAINATQDVNRPIDYLNLHNALSQVIGEIEMSGSVSPEQRSSVSELSKFDALLLQKLRNS